MDGEPSEGDLTVVSDEAVQQSGEVLALVIQRPIGEGGEDRQEAKIPACRDGPPRSRSQGQREQGREGHQFDSLQTVCENPPPHKLRSWRELHEGKTRLLSPARRPRGARRPGMRRRPERDAEGPRG